MSDYKLLIELDDAMDVIKNNTHWLDSTEFLPIIRNEFEQKCHVSVNESPKISRLYVPNGGTPLSVADAVTRECSDREWLLDVIYYLQTYVDRTFTTITMKGERE